jgi:Fe2+ transport system protein FeoA
MSNVVHLWNPRSNQHLRRRWVSFSEQIIIGGESIEQAGVLSVQPAGNDELRARLRVMGHEYEEVVTPGHDITVRISGLELIIGVKAVEDERMLVEFGIPPGSNVGVTLGGRIHAEAPRMA